MAARCTLCSLATSRKRICWPTLFSSYPTDQTQVMVVAEAPGEEEDKLGEPLIGNAGQEARHQLTVNGIAARGVVLTNICQCHPQANRDPLAEEIRACTEAHLIPLVLTNQPQWIITMGRIATRFFLGDVDMELVHGIPRTIDFYGLDVVVIPTYHPAAGLHNPESMILYQYDMKVAGDVIRGKIKPHPPIDHLAGEESYHEITSPSGVRRYLGNANVISLDTEWARGKMWCLSLSHSPGEAIVVPGDATHALAAVGQAVSSPDTITVIHNALYDLPVLAAEGIYPSQPADTMVMAYLLQTEPQGLKPLSYRHCGMEMLSYEEMVGPATERMIAAYVQKILEREWPDPAPVLEWTKGEPKVRQPQNIKRRAAGAVKKGVDLHDWWKKTGDKEEVEAVLGPFQEGELCDIPRPNAIRYSARDADATIRIWPILLEKIQAMGLEDTFWRDMRAMPMVVDMMANGMPVNVKAFQSLSIYFQNCMDRIQAKMQREVGFYLGGVAVNPASYPQMSSLVYDHLKLQDQGGKFKSKKSTTNKSTSDDILKRYVGLHPVVTDIIDWRGYQKLKSSYADAIPPKVVEGRVHTTLRMTRTTTGRLSSSNPNLMAQPVRSSEGRKIRDCYEAPEGKVLLSGDYSQVEMRVAANDSQDDRMCSIFWQGQDIHAVTASDMFGIPIDQLDEMKHRYPAKRVGFGILNLITAEGLQRELAVGGAKGWSVSDCEEMIKAWFSIYKGVAAYMKANGEHAKRYGYVRDMWGRIRYIPGIRSINRWGRIEAERQAGNAPIQMGAQGVIKEAMGGLVPLYRSLGDDGIHLKPLIQIHDDIVWEVDEWAVDIVKPMIAAVMEKSPPGFIIPLEVDFKSGKKWGSMKK